MNLVVIMMICFLILFTSSSCTHGPYESPRRQQANQELTPHEESAQSPQPDTTKKGTEKEQKNESPEEERSFDSKVKAVDDFMNVLDDIMN